jgi:hypothetical protein
MMYLAPVPAETIYINIKEGKEVKNNEADTESIRVCSDSDNDGRPGVRGKCSRKSVKRANA